MLVLKLSLLSLPQQCNGLLPNEKRGEECQGLCSKKKKETTIIAIIHMNTTFIDRGFVSYAYWV